MASVFSSIIAGDLPGHFVWKDEISVAFLSINPISDGHTLVVPRAEVDHWLDLPPQTSAHLMTVSHHVGQAVHAVFEHARVGMMIAGFEVPHTHLHVLGINGLGDLSFANAAASVDHEELARRASAIRSVLVDAGHEQAVV